MTLKLFRRLLRIASVGVTTLVLAGPLLSQNCALCYTQASASGSRMIDALKSGILTLVIPPTLMWLVIAAIAYSKRNQFRSAEQTVVSGSDW